MADATDDLNAAASPGPNIEAAIPSSGDANWGNYRWRHGGNRVANFSFADGHAASVGIGDLLLGNILFRDP